MLGDTVIYVLADYDVSAIVQQRGRAPAVGNTVYAGQPVTAMIVADFNGPCNLKLMLDGSDTFWVTSRIKGNGPGQWMPLFSPATAVRINPPLSRLGAKTEVDLSREGVLS